MKKSILILFFSYYCNAQSFESYKIKTTQNKKERTEILNLIRKETGDYIFIVDVLNVNNKYAWFTGRQLRKDGKNIETNEYEDCCHTEALLKKDNDKWKVIEFSMNSTDLWWGGLWEKYKLSKSFFNF